MRLIGLMSGTSVDGIDAALVTVEGGYDLEPFRWRLEMSLHRAWTPELRAEIFAICCADAPLQRVTALNFRLGEVFGEVANHLMQKTGMTCKDIAAICSHGQTIWHQAEPFALNDGSSICATLQIGEGAMIAEKTGCRVVCDFRTADMAAGGQGAPLVPFVDRILFSSTQEDRAVQNIGGIANVTFLPKDGDTRKTIAFDTGPGNMVIDALISRATGGKETFDRDGERASRGTVHQMFLNDLLAHPFFAQLPPKSTGREEFGLHFVEEFRRKAVAFGLSVEDSLATATALTAESIVRAYRRFLPAMPKTVIVGGGGVNNQTLMAMLKAELPKSQVETHANFGIGNQSKEAVAFAILGYRTLLGLPSNLPSATGARHPAILGKMCFPPFPELSR